MASNTNIDSFLKAFFSKDLQEREQIDHECRVASQEYGKEFQEVPDSWDRPWAN